MRINYKIGSSARRTESTQPYKYQASALPHQSATRRADTSLPQHPGPVWTNSPICQELRGFLILRSHEFKAWTVLGTQKHVGHPLCHPPPSQPHSRSVYSKHVWIIGCLSQEIACLLSQLVNTFWAVAISVGPGNLLPNVFPEMGTVRSGGESGKGRVEREAGDTQRVTQP